MSKRILAKQGKYLKVSSLKKESLSTELETQANLSYMEGEIKQMIDIIRMIAGWVVLNRDHTNANNEEECDQQYINEQPHNQRMTKK